MCPSMEYLALFIRSKYIRYLMIYFTSINNGVHFRIISCKIKTKQFVYIISSFSLESFRIVLDFHLIHLQKFPREFNFIISNFLHHLWNEQLVAFPVALNYIKWTTLLPCQKNQLWLIVVYRRRPLLHIPFLLLIIPPM